MESVLFLLLFAYGSEEVFDPLVLCFLFLVFAYDIVLFSEISSLFSHNSEVVKHNFVSFLN